ncbi:MAG: NAD(P)H-binding protein [Nocardioidaceae bacterium]|nr:NAD(P)H-binding protein [Nocardioidaceae bacterium]
MRALVTGASGYVGSRLVAELAHAGHEVLATSRRPESLEPFDWPRDLVTPHALDVGDDERCAEGMAGIGDVDVAYYLVHAIGSGSFAEKDRESARRFGRAARDAGVGRIVYLGGFVPEGETLSEHLDSRAEVGEELQRSGCDVVWLKAAIVTGAGSTPYELIRHLAERLPIIPVPAWMDHHVQPIAITDVLHYLIASADPDVVPAGAYDIAGEETVPYTRLIELYVEAAGLRRRLVRVHGVTPGMAAPAVARLTPVPTAMMEDLVLSMSNSMQSGDDRIRGLVPDPEGGLVTVVDSLVRARGDGGTPPGVYAATDLIAPVATDPEWSRREAGGITHQLSRVPTVRSLLRA